MDPERYLIYSISCEACSQDMLYLFELPNFLEEKRNQLYALVL